MDEFTNEQIREIKQLLNIVKYAKPKRRNIAEEKLYNIVNQRIDDGIKKGFNLGEIMTDLLDRKGKW